MYPNWFFSFPIKFMQEWFIHTIKAYFASRNTLLKIFLFPLLLPVLLLTPLIFIFSGLSMLVALNPIPITFIGPLWPITLWILFAVAFPFLLVLRLTFKKAIKISYETDVPENVTPKSGTNKPVMVKKNKKILAKIFIILGILGTLTGIALLVVIIIQSIDMMPGDTSQWPLIFTMLLVFIGGPIVFALALGFFKKLPKYTSKYLSAHIRKKNSLYLAYPFQDITDYKKELDETRAAFAADNDPQKNIITYRENVNFRKLTKNLSPYQQAVLQARYTDIDYAPLYDYSTIEKGKIYYGCLIQTNTKLLIQKKSLSDHNEYPACILYSEDPYFEDNPLDLIPIAKKLFADKPNNILKNEHHYFYHLKLTDDITEGKNICMTTLMIDRTLLPMNVLRSQIFPIIAAPEHSTSVFTVDDKYWTKNLVTNYIYDRFEASYEEKTIFGKQY